MAEKECKKKKSKKRKSKERPPDFTMMKYSCSKCGLYSIQPKHLCKPEKI